LSAKFSLLPQASASENKNREPFLSQANYPRNRREISAKNDPITSPVRHGREISAPNQRDASEKLAKN
jgi:hypothetical protein